MKKLLLIILFFTAFETWGQQGLQMEFTKLDSTQLVLQRQIEYYQLVSGNSVLMDNELTLPPLNLEEEYLKRYTLNLDFISLGNYNYEGFSAGSINPFYSPYTRNSMVLSSAAYRLGEKFTLGGYSYGANTIHSAPFPNQGNTNFDTYGSTIYMEYKVSKNFKIGTQINVQQGNHPPGF